jgi:hypothetical protein
VLLKITYSPVAERQITELRAQAEAKPDKPIGKLWKAVRRAIVEVLPEHGLDPSHVKSQNLSGIRAMHVGDRKRLVWIASAEKGLVTILMLGDVKEGDKHDTYAVLAKELGRGTFDTAFAELEIPKPGENAPPPKRVETLPPPEARAEEDSAAPVPPDAMPTSNAQPLTLI